MLRRALIVAAMALAVCAESGAAAETALPAAGTVLQDCAPCTPVVVIPAGSFMMGAGPGEEIAPGEPLEPRNTPQHRVTFARPFAIGQHEVTRAEFAAFVKATGYQTPKRCMLTELISQVIEGRDWAYPPTVQYSDVEPVLCTNYDDARAYTQWLSAVSGHHYRLPSEAEWEYSARAGTTTRYFWGDSPAQGCRYSNIMERAAQMGPIRFRPVATELCTNHPEYAQPQAAPVKAYLPNPWGLYGIMGNGWEVVEDCWHQDFRGAPDDGSAWGSDGDCHLHTIRDPGGRTADGWAGIAHRYAMFGDEHRSNTGTFRVARDL